MNISTQLWAFSVKLVLAVMLGVAFTGSACGGKSAGFPRPIPPGGTTDFEGSEEMEEKEEALKRGRELWLSRIHRAGPGVDWKAIEAENHRRELDRRNGLLTGMTASASVNPWSEVGSKNLAGRMLCAVIGPSGGGGPTLYGGSALGGVWKGSLTGTPWTPLTDSIYGGASRIVAIPGLTGGTPDRLVAQIGNTLYASDNGGATWVPSLGVTGYTDIRGLGSLQDVARTILTYVKTSDNSRLYASTDGGKNFSLRWSAGASWSGSLWVPRKGAAAVSTVYVLHQGAVRVSTDGGLTFLPLDTVDAAASEGLLMGSEAGNPTLYVAVKNGGTWKLRRSLNAGASFSGMSTTLTDFGGNAFTASTTNSSVVHYGGVECWRSTNSGTSFTKVNSWGEYYGDPANKLHADIMGLHCWPDPIHPSLDRHYASTDGGIYESLNGGVNWNNLTLSGLGVSQYYSTLTSRANPTLIAAGSQDQGYQRGVYTAPSGPGPSTSMTQLIGGDFGHLTSSDGTLAFVYATYPGIILVQKGETSPQVFQLNFPAGVNSEWMPPVVADPLDTKAFFFLGNTLWRFSSVNGLTWSGVQHSAVNFTALGGSYLTGMAFAPTNPQRAYAVNDIGKLYLSMDHGLTWSPYAGSGPNAHYFYGSSMAVHPQKELEAVVAGSGYSGAGVWRTVNGGGTWANYSTGLPLTTFYGIVYADNETGDLFAATEAGAYRRRAGSSTWENIMGLTAPNTSYWSVESLAGGVKIRFGTYGRGIWDFENPIPGIVNYGIGTPGCLGSQAMGALSSPKLGTTFAVTCNNTPASALGLLFVTDAQDLDGSDPFGLSLKLHIRFDIATEVLSFDMTSSAVNKTAISLAVPNNAVLVGKKYYAQSIWAWTVPCVPPPYGLSSSDGIEITIQP